ncbi:MAG: cobalamin-binding protein [Tissierellales bacterium]|jgi:iron complex transport system substrate-binding protein|nr:cobalamin-binding protein [Tissierellales bacterium]
MKRKILSLIVVLILIFTFVGCGNQEEVQEENQENQEELEENEEEQGEEENESQYPVNITDGYGREIELEKPAEKIISLAPSMTETIFALGAGDRLVGVTTYCNYPEEAKEIDQVGDFEGPNLESVIEKNPDVVVALAMGDDEKSKLEDAGITVFLQDPQNLDEVFDNIKKIGTILGLQEEAESLTSNMNAKKDSIIETVSNYDSKKVFYEVWSEPLMTAGPGSILDEMINLSNGENIAYDAESLYPEYSLELLIERNPEVYLTADDGFKTVEDIKNREGYENITAIKENNIYMLHPDIVSRTGPRIIEGLEMIAQAIHPEAFQGK